ncbi:hypothetical protein ABT160_30415 [Streptomyces sp. NPDC001941]|uniref:Rv1733c family protein n=1 Tax=Streptomyces sp. NPDC001941 TaxID=3154659 RepID=UPI0033224726
MVRTALGLRRWRHNPLRRTTDLVEAWTALLALLLLVLGVPAAGVVGGRATDASLTQEVRRQHATRHRTTATVLGPAAPARTARDPGQSEHPPRRAVTARWTATDGTPRTGPVATASPGARPGTTLTVWTDPTGRLVNQPLGVATAHTHAVLTGLSSALLTALLVEGVRRLVVWRLVRRRYARLDRAWAAAGPDWGRTGTGS